jgi:O-phosphoseryl-tRNA(Cys) synthetase
MCFGCKKVTKFLPAFHLSDCPEAEKHIATLKEMIAPSDADPIKELEMLNKRFKKFADENDELVSEKNTLQVKNDALVKLIEEMCEGMKPEESDKWLKAMDEALNADE